MTDEDAVTIAQRSYRNINLEIARRLRENDHRGDEKALREAGAKAIEDLVELNGRLQQLNERMKQVPGLSR